MPKLLQVPAISHELEFIARHTAEADAVYDEEIRVSKALRELTEAVYERADDDVATLLAAVQNTISDAVRGLLRVRWARRNLGEYWEGYAWVYNAAGPKKQMGWVGANISSHRPEVSLICWVSPRGGLDGRRKIVRACNGRIKGVRVVSDNQKQYPGWSDCVVWFDRKLTLKDSRDQVCADVVDHAKRFFRIASKYL